MRTPFAWLQVYDDEGGDLKLNDVVEVVGVLSRVPELAAAHMQQASDGEVRWGSECCWEGRQAYLCYFMCLRSGSSACEKRRKEEKRKAAHVQQAPDAERSWRGSGGGWGGLPAWLQGLLSVIYE